MEDNANSVLNAKPVKGRYLELILATRRTPGLLARGRQNAQPSTLDYIRVLEQAKKDRRIRGVALNAAGFYADMATLWELRLALESFKESGKKVVAYFGDSDFNLYGLLSAADRIVMDDTGTLTLQGYAYGRGYFQHTLEKLGVGVRELRYLDYKSAMESYTRDSFSTWDLQQYNAYLDDIYALTSETIIKARNLDAARLTELINRDFMFSAKSARENALVDKTGRQEAVAEAIAELEGGPIRRFVRFGNPEAGILTGSGRGSPYKPSGTRNFLGLFPEIAVITARGATDFDQGMGAARLSQTIREVSRKSSVKAMVIRINSSGGGAQAADYVAEAIRDAQSRIPVVASLGAVAASGGYWAAMYANHIVASPYSLTGSIGVIGSWFYNQGIYEKTGVSVDVIKRGEHADLGIGVALPGRDLTDEEEERFQRYILDVYDEFVKKVASGRKRSVEDIHQLAQGRVYSGIRARQEGLADSLGGLGAALNIARELAGIAESRRVIYQEYPKPTMMESLMARYLFSAPVLESSLLGEIHAALPQGLASESAWTDLLYRVSHNGQALPLLPIAAQGWYSQ